MPQSETVEPETLAQTVELNSENGETNIESNFEIGDFVWAKKKEQWWPARIWERKKTDAEREVFDDSAMFVSYIGSNNSSNFCKLTELKPFVDNFVVISGSSKSKSFLNAVNCAVLELGKVFEANMSCTCLNDAERRKIEKFVCNNSKFNNFSKEEFLCLVKDVSLDVSVVNTVESVKLKSWVIAFERYLSINGCHGRKKHSELGDKIDLNISSEDSANVRRRKKNVFNLNSSKARYDDGARESYNMEEVISSSRRERKKSKYLSPPYTNLSIDDANTMVSPQPRITVDNEEKFDALKDVDGVDVKEVVSELNLFAIDNSHLSENPLTTQAKRFLLLFREFNFHKRPRNPPDDLYVEEGLVGESEENVKPALNGVKTIERRGRKKKNKLNDAAIVIPINYINFNGTTDTSNSTLEHSKMLQIETITPSNTSGCKRGRRNKSETSGEDIVLNFANKAVKLENNNGGEIVNVPIGIESSIKQKKKIRKASEDPAALLLSFLPETSLPSKDELFSKCCSYGPIIESESEYQPNSCSATIVFAKSSDAEKAFNDSVAAIGNQVSSYRLRYLTGAANPSPPVAPPPVNQVQKPPLPYIRKSLENMISSMGGVGMKPEMSENLIGEMQGLLSKVDMLLTGPAAGTST